VRQMLAEALILAAIGALLGVGLAWLGIHQLLVIAPPNLPRLESIAIDSHVVGFAALAGLAAALFSVFPALRASRPNVIEVLRTSDRRVRLASGRTLLDTVVVVDIALSFVLLIGSGLIFRSFLALQRVDLGYDPHCILTFLLLGGPRGETPQERAAA